MTSYRAATIASIVVTSAGFAVLTGKGDGCGVAAGVGVAVGVGVGVGVWAETPATPNRTMPISNSAARVLKSKQILFRTISCSPLSVINLFRLAPIRT